MWRQDIYEFESIGIVGSYKIDDIPKIKPSNLRVYNQERKTLQNAQGVDVAKLYDEREVGHGSYGNIYLAKRNNDYVFLKQPREESCLLIQEAVLQNIAQKSLEIYGLGNYIPEVHDVFLRQERVWFSMKAINGKNLEEWMKDSTSPDIDLMLVVGQLSLVLWLLETNLGLDHRDIKCDNILVLDKKSSISVSINETTWCLQAPFQIVIIDFGFACIGSGSSRTPIVNLGGGILPQMDPCPKEGRDLFHFLTSVLSTKSIEQRLSRLTVEKMDKWLSKGKSSYGVMARRWSTENWTYLVASQKDFSLPLCAPRNIMSDLLVYIPHFISQTKE